MSLSNACQTRKIRVLSGMSGISTRRNVPSFYERWRDMPMLWQNLGSLKATTRGEISTTLHGWFPSQNNMNGWFTSKKSPVFVGDNIIIFQTFAFLGFKMLIFTGCNWGEILLKERYLTTVIHHWGAPSISKSWNVEHIDAEGIGLKLFNFDSHIDVSRT